MPRLLAAIACACAVVVRALDCAYLWLRSVQAAPPDSLIHHQWLLEWFERGTSMRGFTLTPSPYFIDLLVQLPIVLVTSDFESFLYGMALAFALLIFASVAVVARITFHHWTRALAISAVTVTLFYLAGPYTFVMHAFMYNHTSEIYSTLGLLALAHTLFRPGRSPGYVAAVVYVLVLAACVLSSPFFIATYCVPVSVGAFALLGTTYVTRRRLGWFIGLSVVGAILGLVVLAAISHYAWPVRGDAYTVSMRRSAWLLKHHLYRGQGTWPLTWAVVVATLAATTLLAIDLKRRTLTPPVRFFLAFLPACVAACVFLPLMKGAYTGTYEFRYLQLPWLLTIAFFVGVAAGGVERLVRARMRWSLPRWFVVVPAGAALFLLATIRGPFAMRDGTRAKTGAFLDCFERLERIGALRDGFAAVYFSRYLNAARLSSDWGSPFRVIQAYAGDPLAIDPRENNILWLQPPASMDPNFVVMGSFPPEVAMSLRARIGEPDRILSCPVPPELQFEKKPTTDIWVFDRPGPRARLAAMAMRSNHRASFSPTLDVTSMDIDVEWGLGSDPRDGVLEGAERVWRRGVQRDGGAMAYLHAMPLPSGRFRLEVDLTAEPLGQGPVAEVVVYRNAEELSRTSIAPGMTRAHLEFAFATVGGPTSGHAMWMNIFPRQANRVSVHAVRLELIERAGLQPFRLLH